MDRWRGKETLLTIAGSAKALSLFRLAAVELVGEKNKKNQLYFLIKVVSFETS